MGEVASEGCSPLLWAGAGSPVAGAVQQARVGYKPYASPSYFCIYNGSLASEMILFPGPFLGPYL